MGIINRVEHGLAKAVHGAFAKAFKSEVQPVEIASAIRRAMDDRAALLGHGRAMVPNLYTIELSQTDYERLGDYEEDLSDDLVAAAQEHADSQGYQPGGPLEVQLVEGEGLETGVFRVRPATAKAAGREPAAREQAPAAPRPQPAPGRPSTRPRSSGPLRGPTPPPARGSTSPATATRSSAASRPSAATRPPTSSSTTRASRGGTARSA